MTEFIGHELKSAENILKSSVPYNQTISDYHCTSFIQVHPIKFVSLTVKEANELSEIQWRFLTSIMTNLNSFNFLSQMSKS